MTDYIINPFESGSSLSQGLGLQVTIAHNQMTLLLEDDIFSSQYARLIMLIGGMVSTATGSKWNSFGWPILLIYSMEHCWLSEWDALKLQSPSSPYTRPVDPPEAGCRSSVQPPPSPRPAAPTTSRHCEKRGRASRKASTEKMQWTRVKWTNSTDPNKHGISKKKNDPSSSPIEA